MSLARLVYYSAAIAGWAALLAWAVAEALVFRPLGGEAADHATAGMTLQIAIIGAIVGASIGAGVNLVSGMANPQWLHLLRRVPAGLIGGGLGGAIGGSVGCVLFALLAPPKEVVELSASDWLALSVAFALGWMFMGMAIGAAEGLCEWSLRSVRNALLGGAAGGLAGGTLFGPLSMATSSGMGARATAFVILGLAVGALVGLAQVVLKEAWLTVVDGFRPGRQLILSRSVTWLGCGEHLPLPMLGYAGRDLEAEHARITRQPTGQFVLADNRSRVGTRINGRLIQGPVTLQDGDLIKLGSNIVRFNVRHGRAGGSPTAAPAASASVAMVVPPPVPSSAAPPVGLPRPVPLPSGPPPPPAAAPTAGATAAPVVVTVVPEPTPVPVATPPQPPPSSAGAAPMATPPLTVPPRPATPPPGLRIPPPPPPPPRR